MVCSHGENKILVFLRHLYLNVECPLYWSCLHSLFALKQFSTFLCRLCPFMSNCQYEFWNCYECCRCTHQLEFYSDCLSLRFTDPRLEHSHWNEHLKSTEAVQITGIDTNSRCSYEVVVVVWSLLKLYRAVLYFIVHSCTRCKWQSSHKVWQTASMWYRKMEHVLYYGCSMYIAVNLPWPQVVKAMNIEIVGMICSQI